MSLSRSISATLACFLLGSCTGMFEAISNDPVRTERILAANEVPVVGTLSLAAERRIVLIGLSDDMEGKFCAEPPPEVAKNIQREFGTKIEAKDPSLIAELENIYQSNIVHLAERTVLLDLYRTGTYSLCQYYLNEAISGDQLYNAFNNLTDRVVSKVPEQPS